MKILLTGNCGFIGTNFVKKHAINHEIIGIDKLTYAANKETLKLCKTYGYIDIAFPFMLRKIFEQEKDIDVVIHMAAESHVDNSIANAAPFIQTNVGGTYNMLNAAREYKVPVFVHVSTDEVFGDLKYENEPGFNKSSQFKPNSPYAASKASAEMLARSFCKTHGMDVRIIRGCNNYGEFQHKEKLIPKVITNALNDETIPVYNNGAEIREWIYVDDFCQSIMNVARKGKRGGVYNIGTGMELSNYELICLLLKKLDKPRSLIEFGHSRKAHDFRYSFEMDVDDKRMCRHDSHMYSIDRNYNLTRTIDFYKERFENDRKTLGNCSGSRGIATTFEEEHTGSCG